MQHDSRYAFSTATIEPEPPRPLCREPEPAETFPVYALGDVLGPAASGIQERVQAPLAICGQSVLAVATLAVQGHADVELPTGARAPINDTAPWPMAVSELEDFFKTVEIMGLVERVPGERDCQRNTLLGETINLDLLMAFLGILDASEVPGVLLDNGLIGEAECEWLWTLLGDGVDHARLRPAVRRAYIRAMKEGIIRWRIN
jgi:hypothetical protein